MKRTRFTPGTLQNGDPVNAPFTARSRNDNFPQFANVDIAPMPAHHRARISGTPAPESLSLEESRRRLEHRLGLNVPYEWWPAAPTLKAIEAAGFRWVQVATPPLEMLADPRHGVRHASALRRSLEVTELCTVVHGPTSLKVGNALHDRAFEGLLEYAQQIGARHVVYHALDHPRRGSDSAAEEKALRRLVVTAEAMRITVCFENLCPVYPGRSSICHDPLSVRDLLRRVDSPAVGMLLDVGHANVVAGYMGVDVLTLVEPVLPSVRLFHVHDNFGARLRGAPESPSVDPLQLDLHLPPGSGSVPWEALGPMLLAHEAPLVMEIHPAHRPSPTTLHDLAMSLLGGREATPTEAQARRSVSSSLRRRAAVS
jgi:sugar phosphate isomerase/epimerase